MELTFNFAIITALIGLIVGMLTGIFGVGGGFLMTPALIIILNIPGPTAVGTDLAAILITSSFALFRRKGTETVDAKLAVIISLGSILGVLTGSHFLQLLKNWPKLMILGKQQDAAQYSLLWMFAILLTSIAAYILFDYKYNAHKTTKKRIGLFHKFNLPPFMHFSSLEQPRLAIVPLLLLGFLIGILTGLMGIGGGVLLLPSLIYLVGQRTSKAAGTSLLLVCISALAAVIRKSGAGDINLSLLVFLLAGSLTGAFAGTKIGLKLSGPKIRLYFIYILTAGVIMIGYKLYVMTF
ncbi:MAG: sulfite exporter TauE/SafE family protein [Planctomycetota bacterium]|jgi:uncharacterized membrane protein YfcA